MAARKVLLKPDGGEVDLFGDMELDWGGGDEASGVVAEMVGGGMMDTSISFFEVWEWESDSGFCSYDPVSTLVLNVSRSRVPAINLFNGQYSVDFGSMTQRNTRSENVRQVRCLPCPSDADSAFDAYVGLLDGVAGQFASHDAACPHDLPLIMTATDLIAAAVRKSPLWDELDDGQREQVVQSEGEVKEAVLAFHRAISGSAPGDYGGQYGGMQRVELQFVSAPWSRLGIIPYDVSNNGRERRERGVRWLVRDVVV